MRAVTRQVVVLGVLLSLLGGNAAAARPQFVTRSGTHLLLQGKPYLFTGMNVYNANSDGTCWYSFGTGPDLDTALTQIGTGGKAIRAWFFQSMATTAGHRDWTRFDHTLAVAKAHGVKVVVTLANQWGDCEPGSGYKDEAWYTTGYTQPDPSGTVSYRAFATEVAARYRGDPTILAWQLMNEAEVKPSAGSGSCSVNAEQILKAWATDVSGAIKAADPNHLVSIGTIGSGQCGAQGAEYQDLHDIPTVDLCEYHDYGSPSVPMPGDQFNGLQLRLNQCGALGKPLFVGETGIIPDDVGGFQARAGDFAAKFTTQIEHGVVGELVWAWDKDGSTSADYDIGPGDPVLTTLAHATLPGYTCLGPALVVAAGVSCQVINGTYRSAAVQPGGALQMFGSTVTGAVTATAPADLFLDSLSARSITVTGAPGVGLLKICGATVHGDVRLSGNHAPVSLGSGCPPGDARSLVATANSGALSVSGSAFQGNVTFTGNTGGVTVQSNLVVHTLACTSNAPAPAGGGNTAARKTGQCSAL